MEIVQPTAFIRHTKLSYHDGMRRAYELYVIFFIEETKQRVLFPRLLISDSSFYRVSQHKDFNWRFVSFQNDKNTAVENNLTIKSDKCVYKLRTVCRILAFTNKDFCDRLYKKERTVTC